MQRKEKAADAEERLRALVADWREAGDHQQRWKENVPGAMKSCANELEAVLDELYAEGDLGGKTDSGDAIVGRDGLWQLLDESDLSSRMIADKIDPGPSWVQKQFRDAMSPGDADRGGQEETTPTERPGVYWLVKLYTENIETEICVVEDRDTAEEWYGGVMDGEIGLPPMYEGWGCSIAPVSAGIPDLSDKAPDSEGVTVRPLPPERAELKQYVCGECDGVAEVTETPNVCPYCEAWGRMQPKDAQEVRS